MPYAVFIAFFAETRLRVQPVNIQMPAGCLGRNGLADI